MSRIVRVSESDYKLQVQSGGNITLDTGVEVGNVYVTGNLTVQGTTTTIDTTNLTIEDNIILLNKGESPTHAGVTEGTAGIEVDRGSRPNAKILFNELISWYDPVTENLVTGTWTFTDENNKTQGIRVASIANDGTADLAFDLQNSDKVLLITNSTNYEDRVTLPNHIPNKQWVNDYVAAGGSSPGVADVDKIYTNNGSGTEVARVQTYNVSGDGQARVYINETYLCQFAANGLTFQNNININENTITNFSVNNLKLTAGNSQVEVDGFIQLDYRSTVTTPNPLAVSTISNTAVIFSSSVKGAGKTGIYFANKRLADDGSSTENVNDELIAKNRALLFSMVF